MPEQHKIVNCTRAGTAQPLLNGDCYALRALAIQPEFAIRADALLAHAG